MSKAHKDLPAGSQQWANEVDKAMAKIKELEAVIRRLTENAGIDMANPKRGINTGDTPSIVRPVGQKVSSLADVDTYNVLEGQVLSWSQQGQKWLPVTLPNAGGGPVDISAVSYSGLAEGYGVVTDAEQYTYNAAGVVDNPFGPDYHYIENWTTGTAYYGVGNWDLGPGYALIEMDLDTFGRPYISLGSEDYEDNSYAYAVLSSYKLRLNNAVFQLHWCTTANRPTGLANSSAGWGCSVYDIDLDIPIWWNGTTWTNALGTPV